MINEIVKDTEEHMKKSVEHTHHEMAVIRTGRASPALLDGIKVDYYGSKVPLRQIANIGVPDARLIIVQPYDRSALASIEKAIQQSDIGLNPQSDGHILRLPIPTLTEERRRELVKYVHKLTEECRVAIRNIRRDANEMVKIMQKDHEISEDQEHDAYDRIQDMTNDYIKKIEDTLKRKEKEIMEE